MNFYIWFSVCIVCMIITAISVYLINTNKSVPYQDRINHAGFIVLLVTSTVPFINLMVVFILVIFAVVLKAAEYIINCKGKKPFCEKD